MNHFDPYESLANAIVIQAAKDYKTAYKKSQKRSQCKETQRELADLESFFRSDWYRTLTSVDGEMIMARIRKECRI